MAVDLMSFCKEEMDIFTVGRRLINYRRVPTIAGPPICNARRSHVVVVQ